MKAYRNAAPQGGLSLGHWRKGVGLTVLVSLWTVGVLGGLFALLKYENSPGQPARAPTRWPAKSRVPLHGKLPTLVLLAHPKCPCTRASLGELEAMMARCQGRVAAHVLFLVPKGASPDWDQTDLRARAAEIPGVQVWSDNEGREAGYFGVATSGQVLLYQSCGRLSFAGGITGSRGHAGDNSGRSAVESLILEASGEALKTYEVYGCGMMENKDGQRCPSR